MDCGGIPWLASQALGGLRYAVRCNGKWRGPAPIADFRLPPLDGSAGRRDSRLLGFEGMIEEAHILAARAFGGA